MVGQRRLRRAQLAVLGAHGERDLVVHAQDLEEQVRNLREAVRGLDGLLASYKPDLDRAFSHRAIVRYDAFRDIGGEQSASIALLDNTASGLVISMIHSRDYARIYVKQLRRSVPDRALSPEEVDGRRAGPRHGATGKPDAAGERRAGGGRRRQAGAGAAGRRRPRGRPATPRRPPTSRRDRESPHDRRRLAAGRLPGARGHLQRRGPAGQHAGRRLPPVPLPVHPRGAPGGAGGRRAPGHRAHRELASKARSWSPSTAWPSASTTCASCARSPGRCTSSSSPAARSSFDRVTKIVSIPHAYGQCREFIREHLDGVEHEPTDSTAEAVRRVSRVERPWVAIGTRLAAEMYECVVVAADIDDAPDNRTRFVFVSRDEARARGPGVDPPSRRASSAASPRTSPAACS